MRPGRGFSPYSLMIVSDRFTRIGHNADLRTNGKGIPHSHNPFLRATREVFMCYLRSNPQRVVEEALHETG